MHANCSWLQPTDIKNNYYTNKSLNLALAKTQLCHF